MNSAITISHQNHCPEIYKEDLRFFDKSPFIVCAMFTPNKQLFFQCADRLSRSCEHFELPYCMYKVANVHKSITPHGVDDPAYTKAHFILFNLERFPKKGILYLDSDIFFMAYPDQIVRAAHAACDFTVYNWLNDRHNEAYVPINRKIEKGNRYSDLYVFSHSINLACEKQLLCSGGVQYYGNSDKAKYLLECWQDFVARYPDFADDECLDYVFNNFILGSVAINTFWLGKEYLRFPWWPHVRPVIIHPGLPYGGRQARVTEIDGRKRVYPERCQIKRDALIFPPDYIIDTRERMLLKYINNQLVECKLIQQGFWIYPEEIGLK